MEYECGNGIELSFNYVISIQFEVQCEDIDNLLATKRYNGPSVNAICLFSNLKFTRQACLFN